MTGKLLNKLSALCDISVNLLISEYEASYSRKTVTRNLFKYSNILPFEHPNLFIEASGIDPEGEEAKQILAQHVAWRMKGGR